VAQLLMTGFPGFLGSALLPRLLARRPDVEAVCLVQPQHAVLARSRVKELEITDPRTRGRIRLALGDITVTGLGLGAAERDRLDDVREVWHLAAVYDLAVAPHVAHRVNVDGTTNVLAFCREVVPLMRAQGRGGSIVNVSSIAARNGGGPGAYLYAGAKGFVSTATRGLAKELAPDRIRVNAVSPGVIQTPFHDRFSTPQLLESFKAAIPLARIGEPDDCVGAFLYLASEQLSGYVTGQILEVNGGQYMP